MHVKIYILILCPLRFDIHIALLKIKAIQEVKIFLKFLLITVKMDIFEEFGNLLNDLQPTSKDGKSEKNCASVLPPRFSEAIC